LRPSLGSGYAGFEVIVVKNFKDKESDGIQHEEVLAICFEES